jgi:hypothetical protein
MPQNPLAFIARSFQKSVSPGQVDQQAALWTTQRHGKGYPGTYGTPAIVSPLAAAQAGPSYHVSNSAGATLSAALATTYVGLCLSNPAASLLNLKVRRCSAVITVAPAATLALGLITGWSAAGVVTHTTPITAIVNGYVGAAASSGSIVGVAASAKVDAACTIVGTPVWDRWLGCNAVSANSVSIYQDLDDDLIIPPGGYVAIGANVAGPAAGFFGSFAWEELAP